MPLVYYLVLLPLSRLPFAMLYLLSDFLYVVLYKVIGYRTSVVRSNLLNSFPEFTPAQLLDTERKFYSHMCDLIVESIKAFTITQAQVEKRFVHRNPELFQKYFDAGKHITLVGGHNGNWELFAVSVAMHLPHYPIALYTPLANAFMNEKITHSRSKYGLGMKSYPQVKEIVAKKGQAPVAIIFGADQCPRLSQKPYWVDFLNQDTPVQFGTERFACEFDTPVIYGVIHKPARGHYEVEYKLVTEQPSLLPTGRITEMHTAMLESDIRKNPSIWLWTHKRWKRSRADFERSAAAG